MQLEQFLEDIKTVVQDGQNLLKAGASEVKEHALEGVRTAGRTVHDYPYQSAGIVFGLGILVGILAYALFTRESDLEQVWEQS